MHLYMYMLQHHMRQTVYKCTSSSEDSSQDTTSYHTQEPLGKGFSYFITTSRIHPIFPSFLTLHLHLCLNFRVGVDHGSDCPLCTHAPFSLLLLLLLGLLSFFDIEEVCPFAFGDFTSSSFLSEFFSNIPSLSCLISHSEGSQLPCSSDVAVIVWLSTAE